MWRHGDVLIDAVEKIPKNARVLDHCVLAEGEVTGHRHEIAESDSAELLSLRNQLYLRVVARQATLIHQEHNPIRIPQGSYRVWQQREYEPKAPRQQRRVVD